MSHSQPDNLAFLQQLIEVSHDGLLAFDADLKLRAWNQQLKNFTGLADIEDSVAIGQKLGDAPLSLLSPEIKTNLGNTLKGQASTLTGIPFGKLNKGFALEDFELSFRPVFAPDKKRVIGGVCCVRNRTNERCVLEQIKQEQQGRLEAELLFKSSADANQLKDELLMMVSHDLRTPMNAIIGWVNLLGTGKLEPNDHRMGLDTIERNAQTQNRMLNDLLDISKIVSCKMSLEIRSFDLQQMLQAASESVAYLTKPKTVEIKLIAKSSGGDLGEFIGDELRLQQVVGNLLVNAIVSSASGAEVRLIVERTRSLVLITVEDDGEGIEAEILPHVFDRHMLARHGQEPFRKGLAQGIGLAVAKHLTDYHGGKITAESPGRGKGSRFSISLPVMRVQLPEIVETSLDSVINQIQKKPVVDKKNGSLGGLKLLIVDDQVDVLSMLKLALNRHGADVVAEDNVTDALEQYRCFHPHIIISDIGMPELGGYDFVRSIREVEAKQNMRTPVVALTAHVREEDRTLALKEGFDLHLSKPIEPDTLVSELVRLAHRHGLANGSNGES